MPLFRPALDELRRRRDTQGLVRLLQTERSLRGKEDAARALSTLNDRSAVPRLLDLLAHRDAHVRTAVCLALGQLADVRSIEPLGELLQGDSDTRVRELAALALGSLATTLKDERALEALAGALIQPENAGTIAASLPITGMPAAIPYLAALVQNKQMPVDVRVRALNGLVRLDARSFAVELGTIITDSNEPYEVRQAAADAAGILGNTATLQALQVASSRLENSELRSSAEQAVGRLEEDLIHQYGTSGSNSDGKYHCIYCNSGFDGQTEQPQKFLPLAGGVCSRCGSICATHLGPVSICPRCRSVVTLIWRT